MGEVFPGGTFHPVRRQSRLDLVPQCLFDNRRMLSGIGIAFVGNVAAIDAVLKHQIECVAARSGYSVVPTY